MTKFFNLVNHIWIDLCGGEDDQNNAGPNRMFWLVWFNMFLWGAILRDFQPDPYGLVRAAGLVSLCVAVAMACRMLRKVRGAAGVTDAI